MAEAYGGDGVLYCKVFHDVFQLFFFLAFAEVERIFFVHYIEGYKKYERVKNSPLN